MKFVFFGSSNISVIALKKLIQGGLTPSLIVTSPDKPKGRNFVLTPPEIKIFADEHKIPVIQPTSLKNPDFAYKLKALSPKLFIVVSFGKIIPKEILEIPKMGILNVHPSLLPKYRGPSPIQYQILENDRNVGVTIMKIDGEVDHGPIVAQEKIETEEWPQSYLKLEEKLGNEGGKLLANILPDYIAGKITPKEQKHEEATFTKKINKEDGLIDLSKDPYKNFLKIMAFEYSPGTYFFVKNGEKNVRVIIKSADFKNGELFIRRVLPEGKKEMDYQDFLRGLR